MNNDVEILAPAGSMDSLVAAVRCGANAVYLGVGNFNARRNAENFGVRELKQAIEYCHVRGVRAYITLNTLISDTEISSALELIKCGCAFGADAFIIQDLGIAKLVRETAPDMPMHASTQMSVSTVDGFRELEELGFKRAVLPRELSFEEIKYIRENTDIELEMFVHGALCMSVSGQCYISGMLGGRSGNRGLCAGPCRLPFSAPGGTGYDLSLKDLCVIDSIPELAELGICSFKIEGRMKRPEYVAAAVTACKNALEGKYDPVLRADLKAVFSRSGFTDGYLKGETGRTMFGIRGKDDVTAAAPALRKIAHLYEKEQQTIPISIGLTAELHKPLMASASTGRVQVFVTSDYKVQRAINHATEVSTIRTQLKKTGGTPFKVQMTDIDIDEGVNIPVSEINNIRRGVLAQLEHKLTQPYVKEFTDSTEFHPEKLVPHTPEHIKSGGLQNFVIRFSSANQIPDSFEETISQVNSFSSALSGLSENTDFSNQVALTSRKITSIIVPANTAEDKFPRLRKLGIPFGVEIPRALYGHQSKLIKQLKNAKKSGASFAYAGTLDGVMLAKKCGLPVMGGFTLNIYNSHTISVFEDKTLQSKLTLHSAIVSTELEFEEINNLRSELPRGVLAYGRTPLMLTRNCPIKNGQSCKTCSQRQYLTDRKGIKFPVVCKNGCSEILNSRPIYLADRLGDARSTDFLFLYFTIEEKTKVADVINSYLSELPPKGEFTRGLYYRGVE